MAYAPVIGLEIHIQAKTKSKMFCRCAADYFGATPNSHVCPVCLGLPGALPVPNAAAIDQCIRLGQALNCTIAAETKFDRKNYFYPDLPKGYQISQYDQPIAVDGYLEINVEGDARRIRIRRVHLEEDTGKSLHEGGKTFLDFNKSGVPLLEVVTEPDFTSVAEVTAFAKLLKQTVEYTGVSDAEMQKGQMRFELNISLRTPADKDKLPPYRVEVKNIGSISVLEKVVQYEIARQQQELEGGAQIKNETRGLKDMTGETVRQRVKETENDYRYFPEPDIPPIHIDTEWKSKIQATIPELPAARKLRYMREFALDDQQAEVLVEQRDKGDWIDAFAAKVTGDTKLDFTQEAVKWLVGDISFQLEKQGKSLAENPVSHDDLLHLITKLRVHEISGTIVKKVIEAQFTSGGTAAEIISAQGLEQVSDTKQIETWADAAIAQNQKVVDSIAKNPNAIKALVGFVMRESKGQANPQLAEQVLREKLRLS